MANGEDYRPFYGAGYDPYGPEAQFQQFLAGQTRDVGMRARPLLDPTLARYQMGLYRDPTQSFRQFLGAYGTPDALAAQPSSYDSPWNTNLLNEATQAANIAAMTGEQFADQFADAATFDPETQAIADLARNQRQAFLARDYLTGQNAAQNQIRWASALLGDQFRRGATANVPEGGMAGAQQLAAPVRRAIGNVMNELYTARLAQDNPGTGFLKWFTGRMGGVPTGTGAPNTQGL